MDESLSAMTVLADFHVAHANNKAHETRSQSQKIFQSTLTSLTQSFWMSQLSEEEED